MIIDENQKIRLFDRFYTWLKDDGLKPKRSERLHRKKIFASLLANDKMTIENFNDFLKDEKRNKVKELIGNTIFYKNKSFTISNTEINDNEFFIVAQDLRMKCTYEQLDEIKKLII